MFDFLNKKTKEVENQNNNKINSSLKEYHDLQDDFSDYNISEVAYDEIWAFIRRNMKDIKETMVIASYLRQVEVPLEEVQSTYSISNEEVEKIIDNELPSLRVKAYTRLKDELPNEKVAFFPDFQNNLAPLYIEFIDRIEYFFEVKRNQNKIIKEITDEEIVPELINNSSFLILLNYFSVKDSVIIASNLDLLDIDENDLLKISSFDEDNFKELFGSTNISRLQDEVTKRIEKLQGIEIEKSYLDYYGLLKEYEDLLNRIEDTKKYFASTKTK